MSYYLAGGVFLSVGVWWLYHRWSSLTNTNDPRDFKVTRLVPETASKELVKSAQDLLKSQWRGCIHIGSPHRGQLLTHFVALPKLGTTEEPDYTRAIGHIAMYLDPKSVLPQVIISRRKVSNRCFQKTLKKAGIDESLLDTPNHPIWRKYKMYFIRSLVVQKSHRVKGIGKALLAACVMEGDRLGSSMLTGECDPELLPFYQKWGVQFEPHRQQKIKRKKMKITLQTAITTKKRISKRVKKKDINQPSEKGVEGQSDSKEGVTIISVNNSVTKDQTTEAKEESGSKKLEVWKKPNVPEEIKDIAQTSKKPLMEEEQKRNNNKTELTIQNQKSVNGPNCPGEHGLNRILKCAGNWICDICDYRVRNNTEIFSCRQCDFDICGKCFRNEQGAKKSTVKSEAPIDYYNLRLEICAEFKAEMKRFLHGVLVSEEV